ncbi:hypothetical protein ACN38_g7808 [Penicillium nordicum]|uniref:Uncharacterized protein n=1 Tax=Penicillium nordicum TaxID=229535 RepID=A0A0M9WE19_9EURO|nr:hypothetical protein ACN38_g7808 [Penicillium nordicum]
MASNPCNTVSVGYDHLSISHFSPSSPTPPPLASSGRSPKFFAYHSSIYSSQLILLISASNNPRLSFICT